MTKARELVALIQNHYSSKIPHRRRDLRIRARYQSRPQQPSMTLWLIYNHDSEAWRAADAGAWLEDADVQFEVKIDGNSRDMDIEARCVEILKELEESS